MTCQLMHRRFVGDTLAKLAITLQNNGVARNLTGLTVMFYMTDSAGTIVISPTSATVTGVLTGEVEYDFTAPQVATAGDYYGWFKVLGGVGGTEPDTYPDDDDGIYIQILAVAQVHTTPDPSIITNQDIAELAKAPRRTRTVEGTIEERSINELIKAQNAVAAAAADVVPWGMRIAKSKPPSTLS